ncbi:MAG: rhodanese-like domain-containing protein [Acidobacteria bacterium]|nr:rhodanese-like domain-containing protein [Acidobacteriota bacterium]
MRSRNCTAKWCCLVGILSLPACRAQSAALPSVAERLERIEEMIVDYQRVFPDVVGIDAATLRAALDAEAVVLVDVRSPEERAISMIPDAISRQEFEERSQELRGSAVVTYCTIGYRSGAYAEQLLGQGWDARNFDGSLLAWTHAGGNLVDAEGRPTRRLHVYGQRWDLAADGYQTVW